MYWTSDIDWWLIDVWTSYKCFVIYLKYCILQVLGEYISVAPIIGSVIGKAMYRLFFCISVSDRRHDEKSSRYGYCVCI